MNQITAIPTVPATPFAGGFYMGRFKIEGDTYALIVGPKAEGEIACSNWIDTYKDVPGAMSYCDGAANTAAMEKAGSDLAKWAKELRIGGNDDWYIPSQDELEIIYRNAKPTTETNSCYARSGINLSAVEPTSPYTEDFPKQTASEAYQEGGEQAFEEDYYWSSTQHAAVSIYAWCQHFYYGRQGTNDKSCELRARVVRRLKL